MRYFIIKSTINGIKNIDKEVTLSFYPHTVKKKMNISRTNLKAIYGMNGCGKSAIVNAFDMYEKLISNKNYIPQTDRLLFDSLINKNNRQFEIELTFATYDEEKDNTILDYFQHAVKIALVQNNYQIIYEKLSSLKAKEVTINGSYRLIYEVINGNIQFTNDCSPSITKLLIEKSANLLLSSTMLSLIPSIYQSVINYVPNNLLATDKIFNMLTVCFLLSRHLFIYLDESDRHVNAGVNLSDSFKQLIKSFDNLMDFDTIMNDSNFCGDYVLKEEIAHYEHKIKNLEKFLRKFRPDLNSIIIDKKINKDVYRCALSFDYGDYQIALEFESTGIKKIVKLFDYFQKAFDGNIVFMDELDANVHDVYLSKLLEFFINYSSGQICFTSHNIRTMDIFKKYKCKNSIDILSDEGTIFSWTHSGHYSPTSQYAEGMIPDSPFNIEDFDFLDVFGD